MDEENNYQNNNYQDNTSNMPYMEPVLENGRADKANGMQIASLVLGIVGIIMCCCNGIGIIPSIIGIVLSVLGGKNGKHGIGTAGLVCSIIGLILSAAIFVFVMSVAPMMGDMLRQMGYTEEMLKQMGFTEKMLESIHY